MSQTPLTPPELALGAPMPDCTLPDGSRLSGLQGQPVILAFAPNEWNPAHAYQSELFAQISREFGNDTAFIDASAQDWHALDADSALAHQLGVVGRRALFLVDEKGVLRWKIEVENGENIHPGEVLEALENLKVKSLGQGGVSRRAFLTATLAATALLALPLGSDAAPSNAPMPGVKPESKGKPLGYDTTGTIPVTLKINGKKAKLQIEPRVALLDALREYMGMTGTKKGCDHGQCGACTVHIDGERSLSCLTLAVMNEGKDITTIEGISKGDQLHPVQDAFIKHDAFQCGYCTPGQIMSAVALLKEGRAKTDAEIRESMSGNLCRCAAYPNIIAAIQDARQA